MGVRCRVAPRLWRTPPSYSGTPFVSPSFPTYTRVSPFVEENGRTMVRTARRRKEDKLQPLSATPWEELVGGEGRTRESEIRFVASCHCQLMLNSESMITYTYQGWVQLLQPMIFITALLSAVARPLRVQEAQGRWRWSQG